MKRGLIAWDKAELPPAVFEARLDAVRKSLAERELPAAVVYSDVFRSNQARFLINFMPYWNRSLLVIPREGAPVLLCALSARVYPWIRSVSAIEDIRPAGALVPALLQLCAERHWKRIGVLDLPRLPEEISRADVEMVDVPVPLAADDAEFAMRRRTASLARQILTEELPNGAGKQDYEFAGRLERALRRAGAEDLVILLSAGRTSPRPAEGATLAEYYSAAIALEYRGHWAKVTRARTSGHSLRDHFEATLKKGTGGYVENLSGPYPAEGWDRSRLAPGSIFVLHVESRIRGHRLFYGDTCVGTELL